MTRAIPAGNPARQTLALCFILSVIAGSTDAIGFLGLGGLFTAHITGNLVILAARVMAGDPAILSYILSVPVFMLALLLTRLISFYLEQRCIMTLCPLLWLQLLLLAAFLILGVIGGEHLDAKAPLAVAAGMSGVTAMAVQTALVQISLGNVPSTAVMTTNVTRFVLALGELIASRDATTVAASRKRAIEILPVIVGFTLGCSLGAFVERGHGLKSLWLPTGLAILAVGLSFTSSRQFWFRLRH
jgi:uncharacterized membrane protein YoaK (UPF0700 family)